MATLQNIQRMGKPGDINDVWLVIVEEDIIFRKVGVDEVASMEHASNCEYKGVVEWGVCFRWK